MGVRVRMIAVAVLLAGGVAWPARAGLASVAIPDFAGPAVTVPAALRTRDGGAIVLGEISRRAGGYGASTLVARVDATGALDLRYGYEGIARPVVGPAFVPTALAIDPQRGEAWIGGSEHRRSEIVALGPTGLAQTGFGDRGVVRLPADDDGGVRAMAWRTGRVLVSSGQRGGCPGCALTLLSVAGGRPVATATLTPAAVGGPACVGVTGIVFDRGGGVLVSTGASDAGSCHASLVGLSPALATSARRPLALPPQPWSSLTLSPEFGATCVAGSGTGGIAVWPLGAARATPVTGGAGARLVAVLALGDGACAVLVERNGEATVAQAAAGSRPAVTRIPAAMAALAMVRCRQHLLVITATGPPGRRSASIVAVPISRGPYARAGAAQVATTTGCT